MTYTTYQLGEMVVAAANRYGIAPRIGVEQIRQESNFRPDAVGPRTAYGTAKGIAQFIDGTWARYGQGGSPFDPAAALDAWGRYMRDLLNQFNGRYDLALAAYNSGENRAEYHAAAAQGRAINWSALPAGVQSQTQNYVNRILQRAGQSITSAAQGLVNAGVNLATSPRAQSGYIGAALIGLAVILILRSRW